MVILIISMGINVFFFTGKGINITNNKHIHQEQYKQQSMLSIGLFANQGRLSWERICIDRGSTGGSEFYNKYETILDFLMTLSPEQSLMSKITQGYIYYPVLNRITK